MSFQFAAVLAAALASMVPFGSAHAQGPVPSPVQPAGDIDSRLSGDYQRLTSFGERPSWSPDGRRIAFMEKSFGDAFEILFPCWWAGRDPGLRTLGREQLCRGPLADLDLYGELVEVTAAPRHRTRNAVTAS